MLSLFCQRSVQERPLITFARFKTCEAQGRRNLSLDGKRLYSFGSVLVKASSTKKMGENGRAWIILASRASMCFKSRVVRIADLQVRLETISVPNVHVHMIYTFAGTVWVCRTNLTGKERVVEGDLRVCLFCSCLTCTGHSSGKLANAS